MNQEKITEMEKMIKQKYQNTAGIMVLKNKQMLYENYFNNCTAESPIHVFSVTKSVISLLVGIALDRGEIQTIDQPVLDFFPDYAAREKDINSQRVTIKDLLTMTAPYKHQSEPYADYFMSSSYSEFALNLLGGNEPDGTFRYTPLVGPDILSGILTKATGRTVFDYAAEHLFSPLEINVEKNLVFHKQEEQMAFYGANNISGWVADSTGVNTAGWGLTLTLSDLAKIGQLYLNKGIWEEKQLVSAEWLEESTRRHSCWKERNLSYGYLWWVLSDSVFAAMGDGGNVIYVDEKEHLVIAMTGLFEQDAGDRIKLIERYVRPIMTE